LKKALHLKMVKPREKKKLSAAPATAPAPGKRTGWNVAKKPHASAGTQLLVQMLFARANELGHQLQEMAAQLGVVFHGCPGYPGYPKMHSHGESWWHSLEAVAQYAQP
jgi:hypothetical protein